MARKALPARWQSALEPASEAAQPALVQRLPPHRAMGAAPAVRQALSFELGEQP